MSNTLLNRNLHKLLKETLIRKVDASEGDRKRKKVFFSAAAILSFPILIGFIVIDTLEQQPLEIAIDVAIMAIIVACLICLNKFSIDLILYRISLFFISLLFVIALFIGSGEGTILFWYYLIPLLYFFFFGLLEGSLWSLLFFIIETLLLLDPLNMLELQIFPALDPVGLTFRFIASLIFVIIVSYGLEQAREISYRRLQEKNLKLEEEKALLARALGEIKTLNGLLPICSNCKKIRDDDGYWHDVASYIHEHSDADFTHGMCPDCMKQLYPEHMDITESGE